MRSNGHGFGFVIGRFQSVLFVSVFQGSLPVIILFQAITDLFALKLFLILVTCKNKAMSAFFPLQKFHSPSQFPSLFLNTQESFSVLFL